ncbi:MAG: hypothetical protein JXQ87_19485, partial [Bacteroidia bacterium]
TYQAIRDPNDNDRLLLNIRKESPCDEDCIISLRILDNNYDFEDIDGFNGLIYSRGVNDQQVMLKATMSDGAACVPVLVDFSNFCLSISTLDNCVSIGNFSIPEPGTPDVPSTIFFPNLTVSETGVSLGSGTTGKGVFSDQGLGTVDIPLHRGRDYSLPYSFTSPSSPGYLEDLKSRLDDLGYSNVTASYTPCNNDCDCGDASVTICTDTDTEMLCGLSDFFKQVLVDRDPYFSSGEGSVDFTQQNCSTQTQSNLNQSGTSSIVTNTPTCDEKIIHLKTVLDFNTACDQYECPSTGTPYTKLIHDNNYNASGYYNLSLQKVACDDCEIQLWTDIEDNNGNSLDYDDIVSVVAVESDPDHIMGNASYAFKIEVTVDATKNYNANEANNKYYIYGTSCYLISNCFTDKVVCNPGAFREIAIDGPCENVERIRRAEAEYHYNEYLKQLERDFRASYINECLLSNTSEELLAEVPEKVGHYTLYNYDRSGNLLSTVPPEGVEPLSDVSTAAVQDYREGTTSTAVYPAHRMLTSYEYNSYGGVISTQTPDGGLSTFYYDVLGRIVLSQNDKQKLEVVDPNWQDYSYTRYDDLGRVLEAGELNVDVTPGSGFEVSKGDFISDVDFTTVYTGSSKSQVTQTVYDQGFDATISRLDDEYTENAIPWKQDNLRNRVSYIMTKKDGVPTLASHHHATYYSYDILGNVKSVVHEEPKLAAIGQEFKKIDYHFDLVSGNINEVWYQHNKADRFYHKYSYDADNRLISASTSSDHEIWRQDVSYEYYRHGPLARVALGHDKIQGLDYAYTLHGWIKALNGNVLDPAHDIGRDGSNTGTAALDENKQFARDAFGFVLGYYYDADNSVYDFTPTYKTSGTTNNIKPIATPTALGSAVQLFTSLFNGNIGYQSIANRQLMSSTTDVYNYYYKYDQLNRLKAFDLIKGIVADPTPANGYFWTGTTSNEYKTAYTYDANGNIETLSRNGNNSSGWSMDLLTYHYPLDNNSNKTSNRLQRVDDSQTDESRYENDFEDMANNYAYDAIGNLVQDPEEEIASIEWNVQGKVDAVKRISGSSKSDLYFEYDAMGNRVLKTVSNTGIEFLKDNTFYVRDATGNVLATYSYQTDIDEASPVYFDAVFDLLDSEVGRASFKNFIETHYWSNANYANNLIQNIAAVDVNYLVSNEFTLNELFNLNASYLSNTISAYDYNNLIGLFLTYEKLYFVETLIDFDATTILTALLVNHRADILNNMELNSSIAEIDAMHLALFPGSPPKTTTQKIADLMTVSSSALVAQMANHKIAVSLAVSQLDISDLNFEFTTNIMPTTLFADALNISGTATTNQNTIVNNDASYGRSILLGVNTYATVLNELKSTYSTRLIDAIVDEYFVEIGNGFDGINDFTIDDVFTHIETQYGTTTKQNIIDGLGGSELDLVRTYTLEEYNLYGSSRIGVKKHKEIIYQESFKGTVGSDYWNPTVNTQNVLTQAQIETTSYHQQAGTKRYELSNHLGNVYAVVTDRKLGVDTDADDIIDYYDADVVNANDYYPFGMLMPGRSYTNTNIESVVNTTPSVVENELHNHHFENGVHYYSSPNGASVSHDAANDRMVVLTYEQSDAVYRNYPTTPGKEYRFYVDVDPGTCQDLIIKVQNVPVSLIEQRSGTLGTHV